MKRLIFWCQVDKWCCQKLKRTCHVHISSDKFVQWLVSESDKTQLRFALSTNKDFVWLTAHTWHCQEAINSFKSQLISSAGQNTFSFTIMNIKVKFTIKALQRLTTYLTTVTSQCRKFLFEPRAPFSIVNSQFEKTVMTKPQTNCQCHLLKLSRQLPLLVRSEKLSLSVVLRRRWRRKRKNFLHDGDDGLECKMEMMEKHFSLVDMNTTRSMVVDFRHPSARSIRR